jgi:hypothetical protein
MRSREGAPQLVAPAPMELAPRSLLEKPTSVFLESVDVANQVGGQRDRDSL